MDSNNYGNQFRLKKHASVGTDLPVCENNAWFCKLIILNPEDGI